jgi:hemolysin activation/secretion protein
MVRVSAARIGASTLLVLLVCQITAPAAGQALRPEEFVPRTGVPAEIGPEAPVGEGLEEEAAPAPGGASFRLEGVRFEGSTQFGDEALAAAAAERIGAAVTLADLRAIARRVERRYRDAGFVATRVLVPPQTVTDGVVTFRVVEGFVANVVVRGDAGPAQRQVERHLAEIRDERPLTLATVERYLLLARDLPGISVRGTLRAAPDPDAVGGIDLVVDVARKRFDAYANLENGRSEATGPWAASLFGRWNSFAPQAQTLDVLGLVSLDVDELQIGRIGYGQRIGAEGTAVSASFTVANAKPSERFSVLDVDTDSRVFEATVEHPFVRTRDRSVYVLGGFDVVSQQQDQLGLRSSEDELRIVRLGTRVLAGDPFGFNEIDVELRRGLGLFGASEDNGSQPGLSRPNANPQAWVLRGNWTRRQPIAGPVGLELDVRVQWTDDPLAAFEEFSLGNLGIGRGYTPGAAFGDRGWAFSGELQYRPARLRTAQLDRVELFGFYDFGETFEVDAAPGFSDGDQLSSAGAGVRFRLFERFYAEAAWAHPFDEELSQTTEEFGDEFLFRFTALY